MRQQSKRVLVTGAANGIGQATAQELGRAGYALALCDLDAAGLKLAGMSPDGKLVASGGEDGAWKPLKHERARR